MPRPLSFIFALLLLAAPAFGQVVINEIHYHPVEKKHFDTDGNPTFSDTDAPADLNDDVHEFLELRNAGASDVNVSGWKFSSGVNFTFPANTTIPAGGYVVIAKNPARLKTVYGLSTVLGPYGGKLSNGGETVTLVNAAGGTVDSVSYQVNFPWAISANELGADDAFTGIDFAPYQYKGRSLQRVSATGLSNDPANWVAVRPAIGGATLADLPTPGAPNLITSTAPKPVVTAFSAVQASDGAALIRASQPIKITCSFSSAASLSSVGVEYFVENINAFGEARIVEPMVAAANGQFTATLPGFPNRAIVRFRIQADRGDGVETVSPRADDPAVVEVGPPVYQAGNPVVRLPAPHEPWHALFVTPTRNSLKPILDVFVPAAPAGTPYFSGTNGVQAMAFDCEGSPKRVTAENTNGRPREIPYVSPTDRLWNDTVPGVLVTDGVVRDIRIRYHGSRYNRSAARKSYKVFFPEFAPYRDVDGVDVTAIFETDKSDYFSTAHGLHQAAGLPISSVRYVDWYYNNEGGIQRLEQGEYTGELLDAYHERMQRLHPGSALEPTGEYYKSVGFITTPNTSGEGPYGSGNEWPLPASGLWTELQRIEYTYALQNHSWKGAKPMRDTINGLWAARGDAPPRAPNPNPANMKAWLDANWDTDTELTSLALGNWMTPWDDTTQNHFLWRRDNGRWVRLLWDFDAMYGRGDGTSSTSSIYLGENGNPNNNSRGPNWVKDSFIKAYRTEYKERIWFLNNTLLDPENLQTLTYIRSNGAPQTYFNFINGLGNSFAVQRFASVNQQAGMGIFYKPNRPTNQAPADNAAVLPGATLDASAYAVSSAFAHAAAPDPQPHVASRWEIRASDGTYNDPVFIGTSTTDLQSLSIPFDRLKFGETYFWRVTYVAADNHPSITSAETAFSFGSTSVVAGNVVLNEVMAANRRAVANGASFPDYIEIKNNSASPINLTGWSLSDDELQPGKFTFPNGTSLPANGYLVVWADKEFTAPGLHTGFALNNGGQRVLLIENGALRDTISFGPQATDLSIGRVANGTGPWTLTNPSAGATNTAASFQTDASNLRVNEWMADPSAGDDYFELFNPDNQPVALGDLWLGNAPATPKVTQIPALSFIGAHDFTKFNADGSKSGFNQVNFKLDAGGESIVLSSSDGLTIIDSITFGPQTLGVSQGRFPDGSASFVLFPLTSSPGASNWLPAPIVINEALSNSTPPLEDTIEVFNSTANPVNLGGWWLSDDRSALKKYQIPADTIIPAGGYRVFYENQFNPTPGAGTSFSLSSTGDEAILSAVDGGGALTGYRAQVSFGPAADGVSFGRVPTGNPSGSGRPEFWALTARTFGRDNPTDVADFRLGTGGPNAAPLTGPIIINEVMYHPPDLAVSPPVDNTRDEFIELHNITTNPVDISGWRLKGSSDFTFPAGTIVAPADYVLLVSFNPATDANARDEFRATYNLPSDTVLFGPYSSKLGNDTAELELAYPGPAVLGVTPFILVDKLEYTDGAPWPDAADGDGPSLQRISRSVIGNDPANWSAVAATPGNVNQDQSDPFDIDGDGMTDGYEIAHGLNRLDSSDAHLDADSDGQDNLSEFNAGTSASDPASVFTATVASDGNGGFLIRFTAQANRTYTVQFRDDLETGTWQKVADVPAGPSVRPVEIPDTPTGSRRYYRVVTPGQ